jgi:Na+-driven multidrug efflux pump
MGKLTPAGVWTAILLGHATRCALSTWRFNQGRWKTIRVE